ncbi:MULTISPECIES: efflux RND transporter permease subunit [Hyphobacterium]|uniref:Efflux RND transporter permease subunit n=1 Tax=Hyphobacterium vulgare TaxID=1736751 RepID=A0ABV7A0S4_9PROT
MSTGEKPISGAGIVGWFAQNAVAANVLMVILIAAGLITIARTNAEVFPTIDPRTITVSVIYGGASPDEIESSITRRAEEAIIGIEGVRRVSSRAVEGSGTVTVELTDFADASTVADEVQSAIDQLVDFPPENAEAPVVRVVSVASNVVRLVVTGDVGELALRRAAERLERDLIALENVTTVTIQGARDYEISIEISQSVLRQYGLTIEQVSNAIRATSVNLSGGSVRTSAGDILLRTDEEVQDAGEFGEIVILSDFEGQRVRLRDIATIRDGFEDAQLINSFNGRPAIFLQVARSESEDAFDVGNAVEDYVSAYRPAPGLEVLVVGDDTERISDRINLLVRNALMGLALVFVFLSVTLDLRLAFWTTVGIPVAFIGGFLIFGQFTTINMTALFGLIMVLGIVVDDAIVVGENIYERQTNHGLGMAGAIDGARTVLAPVTIGILTTIAIFAPLLFMGGVLGQLLQPVPIVVISVLLLSLAEVFLILPSHLAHGGEWTVGPMKKLKLAVQGGLNTVRDAVVIPVVRFAVRMPYFVIAAAISILLVAAGVVTGGHIRFVFFPTVEGEEVVVELEMPRGTAFAQTERAMNQVVQAGLEAVGGESSPLYRSLSVTIGGQLASGFGVDGTIIGAELATATLELAPASERDVTSAEIERRWREAAGDIPGVRSLVFTSAGLSGGDDLSFNLAHADTDQLLSAVDEFVAALGGIEGVTEIETNNELGSRQLSFALTEAGIAAGLTVRDLGMQVRQAYFGEEVQRIQRGSEEVRVFVRLPEAERRSLTDLASMRIAIPGGGEADLRTVARVEETRSNAAIDRVDGRRVITVTADVDEAITTPNAVTALLEDRILPGLASRHTGLSVSAEGQARDQAEDLRSLMNNLILGIMVMYVLLASTLRSYTQPIVILLAIPFGGVGALIGHMLLGFDLSFLSLFGMVALAGVVVNDSVVLIDYFNLLQRDGRGSTLDNIVEAVRRRFRPILLTTLTTFIGLVPMIAETSVQAQFLIPMAVSIAFGIVFASLIVLVMVPAFLALGATKAAVSVEAVH